MPTDHILPVAAAPADRLTLNAAVVRGNVVVAFYGNLSACNCFSDDGAQPNSQSAFPPQCSGLYCMAGED